MENSDRTIDILLATFNGELYLQEQINSIINQDHKHWKLIIRDDGSSDSTLSIIHDNQKLYPTQIELIEDGQDRVGASQSFSKLMQYSESAYIAFCDQDDIWFPEKLAQQIDIMINEESESSDSIPVLVHSDLRVIDEEKNVIAESFWHYQKYEPSIMCSINNLLIQNHVTGCTMLVNRALLDIAAPIPKDVVMHDWWLALIAICKGKIISMDSSTVMYRQHLDNDTGAKKWGYSYILKIMGTGRRGMHQKLLKTFEQAGALLTRLSVDDKSRGVVESYVNLFSAGWLRKRVAILRYGFFKFGIIRNIAVFLSI